MIPPGLEDSECGVRPSLATAPDLVGLARTSYPKIRPLGSEMQTGHRRDPEYAGMVVCFSLSSALAGTSESKTVMAANSNMG